MKRLKLSDDEVSLVEAFRTEKNIYNGALADAVKTVLEINFKDLTETFEQDAIVSEILKLRR